MKTENNRLDRLLTGLAPFVADGGLETTLIFLRGLDLPLFASFPLLDSAEGRAALSEYYTDFVRIAQGHGTGLILDTPTWRASAGWGAKLGYDADGIARINREATAFMRAIREREESAASPMILNGVIGPMGDGYDPESYASAGEAEAYHAHQVRALASAGVDCVSAVTMTSAEEGIGVARAAARAGVPVIVSFTVETDGRLPSGEALGEAIERTDAETGSAPLFYMVNCAHPSHFSGVLQGGWLARVGGIRANASRRSHAELDEAVELDAGDPQELASDYAALQRVLPNLRLLGGCCGTDQRHIGEIAGRCAHAHAA